MYVLNPAAKTAQRNGVIMAGGRGGFATASVPPGSDGVVTATRSAARRRQRDDVWSRAATSSAGGRSTRRARARARAVAVCRWAGKARARAAEGDAGTGSGGRCAVAGIVYPAEAVSLPRVAAPRGTVNREDLGTQVVEGVVATGTRTTTTIAAGSHRQRAADPHRVRAVVLADLKILVLTKHSY